jgi:hypothetical protein
MGPASTIRSRHPFGICIGEEAADLLIGLDVALRVRVEHEPHPGLLM